MLPQFAIQLQPQASYKCNAFMNCSAVMMGQPRQFVAHTDCQ